jgi:MFS transporter, PAT family, beta-lactamase induction signal transducer AmpG
MASTCWRWPRSSRRVFEAHGSAVAAWQAVFVLLAGVFVMAGVQMGYTLFFVWVCVATLPSFAAAALLKIDPAFGQRQ